MIGAVDEDYGARIRAAAAFADMDEKAAASAFGFSTRTLMRVEKNERPVTLPEAKRVAEATGVPLEFLVQGWAWGAEHLSERLGALEAVIRDLRRELLVLAREASRRIDEDDRPEEGSRPGRQP